jgi:hypothetical protein
VHIIIGGIAESLIIEKFGVLFRSAKDLEMVFH